MLGIWYINLRIFNVFLTSRACIRNEVGINIDKFICLAGEYDYPVEPKLIFLRFMQNMLARHL